MQDCGARARQAHNENRLRNDLLCDLRVPFIPLDDLQPVLQIDEQIRASEKPTEKVQVGLPLDGVDEDLEVGTPVVVGFAVAEVAQPRVGAGGRKK